MNLGFSPIQHNIISNHSLRRNSQQQAGFGANITISPETQARIAEKFSPRRLREWETVKAKFCALPSTATLEINMSTLRMFLWDEVQFHGHLKQNGKDIGKFPIESSFWADMFCGTFGKLRSLIGQAGKELGKL